MRKNRDILCEYNTKSTYTYTYIHIQERIHIHVHHTHTHTHTYTYLPESLALTPTQRREQKEWSIFSELSVVSAVEKDCGSI